jgi:hypothetical protein
MRSRHALLAIALSAGLTLLAAPEAGAQAPGRGRGDSRQNPPQHEQPRQSQPEARPRQDPPQRAEPARTEPARGEPARTPEAEHRPPARSTGEPELRRRKP